MVTTNLLLFHLKDELGDVVYNLFPTSFYLNDVLKMKTLYFWSTYFPKIVKGVMVKAVDGVPVLNPTTQQMVKTSMYKVPKINPSDTYISIEKVYYPGNFVTNKYSSNVPMINGMVKAVAGATPNADYYNTVRYSFDFHAPDYITIDPVPYLHVDFTVDMQRIPRLEEIPDWYFDPFKELFVADTEISIYNKLKHLIKNGTVTYQGVEIASEVINEWSDAKNNRKDLIEKFEKNYWKDPSRYGSLLEFSN